jgi:hypothetical protein
VDYCRLRKTFRIGGSRRQVLLSSAGGLDFLNFGELIGRPEFLKQRLIPDHPRANTLDLQILADLVAAVSNSQAPHSPEYGENSVPPEIPDAIKLLPDRHDRTGGIQAAASKLRPCSLTGREPPASSFASSPRNAPNWKPRKSSTPLAAL